MRTRLLLIISIVLLTLLATACGGKAAAAEAASEASPIASQPATLEDLASLIAALGAAGATVEPAESVQQVFFTVPGQIVRVNGADVQVFEYATAEALETDAAQVSADGGSIGTSMVSWMATPHFYKAGRILVLYVGDDRSILDLLEGILGPQFAGR